MSKRKRLYGERRLGRLADLAARDGWSCYYCSIGLDPALRWTTIDELTPLVRGGTTDIDNQVLACLTCNNDKGDRTEDEYRAMLAGHSLHSYHLWRLELKRRQREDLRVKAGVPTSARGRRRQARLSMRLGDLWPCSHQHDASFCDVCAGP